MFLHICVYMCVSYTTTCLCGRFMRFLFFLYTPWETMNLFYIHIIFKIDYPNIKYLLISSINIELHGLWVNIYQVVTVHQAVCGGFLHISILHIYYVCFFCSSDTFFSVSKCLCYKILSSFTLSILILKIFLKINSIPAWQKVH